MTIAIASGLGSTLGWGAETAYGTVVTPTVFGTFEKNTIKRKNTIVQDKALWGGLSDLGSRRSLVAQMAAGDITMGLYDRGLGKLICQMMGSNPTVTDATRPVGDGATTAASTTVTSATANFTSADVGQTISGGSIPAGATIASVTNSTTVVISAAATATASAVTLTIGSAAYSTVHQPGDTTGKSLTIQSGKPQTNGTVVPFTWGGCKVTGWMFEVKAKSNATLTLTVAAQTESITVAYTAPSYVASNLFNSLEASSVTLGGTASTTGGVATVTGGTAASNVTDFKLTGKLNLDEDRFYLGGSGLMAEPITKDFWAVTGQIDAEFANTSDLYVPWAAQTGMPLQFSLTGPPITGSTHSSFGIVCPQIFLNDAPPTIDGPAILKVSAPFDVTNDGVNPWFQVTTVSLDSAV